MASNILPTNAGQLIGLGNKMLAGLTSLGAALGITQITPAALDAALTAFIATDGAFNAARSTRQAASDGFHTAEDALAAWLGVVRNVLAARFGNRWSTQWAQAGFTNHTTAIPARIEDRLALALLLTGFFTANPSYEVPSMSVTAAHGTTLYDAACATQETYMTATVALKTKGDADTGAYNALVDMMWSLIKILDATLADNDPRWLAFGLNMPATNTTPGKPVNLTVTTDDTGAVVAGCDAVPLATRYRWRMRPVGQTDYVLVARSVDPLAIILGVVPGSAVEIIVQAVNGNLQGVASEPVVFTLPAARVKESKGAAPVAEVLLAAGHTNGRGNGSANGHAPHARAA